jgi:hypothetical protein
MDARAKHGHDDAFCITPSTCKSYVKKYDWRGRVVFANPKDFAGNLNSNSFVVGALRKTLFARALV